MKLSNVQMVLNAIVDSDKVLVITSSKCVKGIYDDVMSLYKILQNIDKINIPYVSVTRGNVTFYMNGKKKEITLVNDDIINSYGGCYLRGMCFDKIIIDEYCKIYEYIRNEIPLTLRRK